MRNNDHFIVTTDYWSGYWKLDALLDTNATTLTKHLRWLLAGHCTALKLITYNGPQFPIRIPALRRVLEVFAYY